jgi:threonine synthase
MKNVAGLRCFRCGTLYPPEHYVEDCPKCRAEAPSNLAVAYTSQSASKPAADNGSGVWRYEALLPVARADAVTLGEGGTPLLSLDRTAKSLGITRLFAKDETRNPTWSFKDRLASVAISAAKSLGARVIVSSSTGNAGAAAAAYAAKAGMPCVIFTTGGAVGPLTIQMRAYGATVLALENKADRWPLMQHAVRAFGWFPTSPFFGPVVGSNPYGIEGYKTLAYEIAERMEWDVPDACVVPVCYGDALLGMWRGFEEMRALGWTRRTPRLMAAEIYGSLGSALGDGTDVLPDMPMTHDTVAKSTTATRSTYQALKAIRLTGGTATVVSNEAIMQWQQKLARDEGLYVEPASAGALAATQQLWESGYIKPAETAVALLTASGLKDTAATAAVQGELPPVPKDRSEILTMLTALNERAMKMDRLNVRK